MPVQHSKRWQQEMAAGVAPPGWHPEVHAAQPLRPPDEDGNWWLRLSLLGVGGAGALCCAAVLRMFAHMDTNEAMGKRSVSAPVIADEDGAGSCMALREHQMAKLPAQYS